jgi:hypothetical protein
MKRFRQKVAEIQGWRGSSDHAESTDCTSPDSPGDTQPVVTQCHKRQMAAALGFHFSDPAAN